jgi:polyphosphate kinase
MFDAAKSKNVTSITATIFKTDYKDDVNRYTSFLSSLAVAADICDKHVTVILDKNISMKNKISDYLTSHKVKVINDYDKNVHAKMILIKFKNTKPLGILSTGNFRRYAGEHFADIAYFTKDKEITDDINNFFRNIIGSKSEVTNTNEGNLYHDLYIYNIKSQLHKLIDECKKAVDVQASASITIKCNTINKCELTTELIEAAKLGVKVTLLVRKECNLKFKNPNFRVYSTVNSIVEHSRIYLFQIYNVKMLYISSADLKKSTGDFGDKNSRVEFLLRVNDPIIKNKIINELL